MIARGVMLNVVEARLLATVRWMDMAAQRPRQDCTEAGLSVLSRRLGRKQRCS